MMRMCGLSNVLCLILWGQVTTYTDSTPVLLPVRYLVYYQADTSSTAEVLGDTDLATFTATTCAPGQYWVTAYAVPGLEDESAPSNVVTLGAVPAPPPPEPCPSHGKGHHTCGNHPGHGP